jgi:uncharacterized protein
MTKPIFLFLLLFGFFNQSLYCQTKTIPSLHSPVIDEAQVLTPLQQQSLEREIALYLPQVQLQVWIIEDLQNETIESLSIRAVDSWRLGNEKKDNGILILVAVNDRKLRIEVGQGLEGQIPDVLAARIIDKIMKPLLREGDYYGAVVLAARKIYELAGGELSILPQDSSIEKATKRKSFSLFNVIFLIVMLFLFVMRLLGLGRRRLLGYGGGWGSNNWTGGAAPGGTRG